MQGISGEWLLAAKELDVSMGSDRSTLAARPRQQSIIFLWLIIWQSRLNARTTNQPHVPSTYLYEVADGSLVGLTARMTCGIQDDCTYRVARQCEFAGELGGIFRGERPACKTCT